MPWPHFYFPNARNINPSLVLVQPSKTRPYITERLLMGRKESNQTQIYLPKAVEGGVKHTNTMHTYTGNIPECRQGRACVYAKYAAAYFNF